ncbi:hypothetical protein H8S33_14300 [Ornithinibacillus sp. BX22]|uniref:DUF5673 domain-containing protein n=1 Tax=Ornithinibacillus hominis TaxID=2763055 RepID=A0A923L7Q2_9BACI|nr:hypothetical protein [Ornithinibacillus hominis]MBC5637964.1 hypothetical protein [Ornithinibacillus hominis]
MKITIGILFFTVIAYHLFHFIRLLIKMKENVVFPVNEAESSAVRKFPDKKLEPPTYKSQKVGIIFYSFLLVFMIGFFTIFASVQEFNNWLIFLFILLPFSYSHDLFNLFAVLEDGLLVGSRFIPWKRVKSVQFKRIDINHRYYGHDKEVNDKGYEMIINKGLSSKNCIVASSEMKEKLTEVIQERMMQQGEKVVWKESLE